MNSAIPAFQDALLAALTTGVTLAKVTLGWPAAGLADKVVWISGAVTAEHTDEVSGYASRDEEITQEVRIKADLTTKTYTAARDAAFAIAAEVEDAIQADPTLGGVVRFARVSAVKVDEAIPDKTIRSVGLVLTVTADATTG